MPHTSRKRINVSLLVPFLVIALVLGIMFVNKYRASHEVVTKPQAVQPSGVRQVALYFVADGTRLGREAREMETCDSDVLCLKNVLEELLNGPVSELGEALPEGTAVTDVSVNGNLAIVGVNRSFAENLPAGSSAEMLAVYSLVDTVCLNFPAITRVKLNVEGGIQLRHLDISEPLAPDYSLETPAAAPQVRGAASPAKKDKGQP